MDVKKKLVELIEKVSYECDEGTRDLYDMREVADGIADFLIAHGVTVQEWISVKDRLPEPWKQVLIYSRYDFCEVALYIGIPGKWRVTWNHDMLDADSVTHWMPLPHPPQGE